ncbi:hypothetical protein [Leptolyngbya sp. Cla-17]|uniref:hypothetical protein n=1 Tax=Leptolyngbya sp. Cla-17 TaxID=2803751 RepID=UPI0019338E3F|nr:hypothetical protein [Leptolyngbya sp. Cla-17]
MMQPPKTSAPAPRSEVARSPSVPISVYREVASELQAARTSLDSLKGQNNDLVQRNQQLRLEIERVVQSALYLRQLADINLQVGSSSTDNSSSPAAETSFTSAPSEQPIQLNNQSAAIPTQNALKQITGFPGKLFTGQTSQPSSTAQAEVKEIGAWWLVLVICMIIVTAFGTGFLIVRPLLPSR